MTKPMQIRCGWCEYESEDASDVVAHMMAAGHGMAASLVGDLKDSEGFSEFVGIVEGIQTGRLEGRAVSPEEIEADEEMPEAVKERLLRFMRGGATDGGSDPKSGTGEGGL